MGEAKQESKESDKVSFSIADASDKRISEP